MSSPSPPIDVSKSRYDTSTYLGRLRHFASVTSPLTLLYSPSQLQEAQTLIKDYSEGKRPDLYNDPEMVYKAKQLVDSSIHPDTGEPVPLPFRMSAFVPTNVIICAGMLLPNPSMASVMFWQWANQTLNVCVNYSNSNKSIQMSNSEIASAYASATATSVSLAVGLNSIVPRLKSLSPSARALASRFVPFAAVASAGCVNVSLMRWKEFRDGIDVFAPSSPSDNEKSSPSEPVKPEALGKSSRAGAIAIAQTAASRVLTNIPTLILPPLIMTFLQRRGTFKGPRGRYLETITNLGLIGTSLLVFLPPAIATFPQRASINTSWLEPQFRDIKDPKTGRPYEKLEFNKGL